jgi:beta-galactosidase
MAVKFQMKITPTLSFATLVLTLVLPALNSTAQNVRVKESLDADWRFLKGDAAEAGTNLSYAVAKPWLLPTANPFTTNPPTARPEGNFGGNVSFAQPGFDDSGWRKLNLPHDFGVESAFDPALPGNTGKLPWFGVAWYRKHLEIPAADAGQKIYLDVDGAMAYAED